MNRILAAAGAGALAYLVFYGRRYSEMVTRPLRHFRPEEFSTSLPFLSERLLEFLDEFRERLGSAVLISPDPGSLYRPWSPGSQHFLGKAADVMLPYADLSTGYKIAREIGFTGIGLYPEWKPYPGMHLDVREDRTAADPALWAGKKDELGKQIYVSILDALKP